MTGHLQAAASPIEPGGSSRTRPGRLPRLGLNLMPRPDTFASVNWLHRIVAMLMLALWMPAASLCLAECAGIVERGDCCADESSGPANAVAHPCCFLASGHYKSPNDRPQVSAPVMLTTAQLPSLISFSPPAEDLVLPSLASCPPELPVTWQFSFRAALTPRAPSVAS